jgi:hypothetical protein
MFTMILIGIVCCGIGIANYYQSDLYIPHRINKVYFKGHEFEVEYSRIVKGQYIVPFGLNKVGIIDGHPSIAIIAHDYLAGQYIAQLKVGENVMLDYGAREEYYYVKNIKIIKSRIDSNFVYNIPGALILQTCVKNGVLIIEAER